MAARVCPYCRELNGATEARCHRCGKRLPGPLSDGASKLFGDLLGREAPVTKIILFIELVVFALCVLVERNLPLGFSGSGFKASTLLRFGALAGPLGQIEPYRLVSSVFVHAGLLHVAMNLWMFVDLGRELERAIGGARLALVFVLTGVLGFVASEWWYAPMHPLTMGASGGVFGQIGAVIGILWARRDPEWKRAFVRNLLYALLLSLAFGGINTAAHLGGFAAGIALGCLFQLELLHFRVDLPLRVLAVVAVLGAVVSVGLATQSTAWQVQRARELYYE